MRRGDLLVPRRDDNEGGLGVVMRPNPHGGVTATVVRHKDFPAVVLVATEVREDSSHHPWSGRVVVLSGGAVVFVPQRLLEDLKVVASASEDV